MDFSVSVSDKAVLIECSSDALDLMAFVCAVNGITISNRVKQTFDLMLSADKFCLSLTGLSLKDAIQEWNSSEVVKKDPSRRVVLLSEV